MTRGRLVATLASLAVVVAITVPSIALARRDHELVPAWRLGERTTTVRVQRLADRLGIPGEAREAPVGWEASEGGVRLVVGLVPGLPWHAGPAGGAVTGGAPASRSAAIRVAIELVRDVGGPRVEVVGGEGGLVIMRPVLSGTPVSAMPWSVLVEKGGRVVRARGWLNRPTPVVVTPEQLRRDDRLLPRRLSDDPGSVSSNAD